VRFADGRHGFCESSVSNQRGALLAPIGNAGPRAEATPESPHRKGCCHCVHLGGEIFEGVPIPRQVVDGIGATIVLNPTTLPQPRTQRRDIDARMVIVKATKDSRMASCPAKNC
jgi:hypothetical protein